MNIRVLDESDAEAYQELRLRALTLSPAAFGSTYEREAAFSMDIVRERIAPSGDKFALGAFVDGRLTAIVTFVREPGAKTSHKANLYGMYTAPEARGIGIGKALLLELIRRAEDCQGVERLNLTVVSDNEPACRLYQSVGFQVYGVERKALKAGGTYHDEDLMVLELGAQP
ncbi:GNAT family N-acetyltransferase [Paenibacillus sp. HN-1]|nr:GNAT family N-acetyltransferase [Paenibacillus sp. CGMCC 1.18879]MBY9084758.1 GNAT family N-acetyltransferase [Paenibacillus sinensis]